MLPGWKSATIAGKRADLFTPSQSSPRFGRSICIAPVNNRSRTNRHIPSCSKNWGLAASARTATPHGGPIESVASFDPTMTAERFIVECVAPEAVDAWQLCAAQIGVFGISMGGQGALRIAFKHSALFPVVAGIASAIDYHQYYGQGTPLDEMYASKEQVRQDTALMHIHPSEQPRHIFFCCDPDDSEWFRGNDRLHEKLMALGVAHECDLETRAGGHTWQYYDHVAERVLRFLVAALEQESRRLL